MSDCGTFCVGCFRNLDEISHWMTYTNQQRKNIVAETKKRKKKFLGDKHGG